MILSLLDKAHHILVAPLWLAKSWKVEITRLWHLALHRELPSKEGRCFIHDQKQPLERFNLLATGVPLNVVVTIERGIIYQKPLCLQILQQQGSSFGRQLVLSTLLFHFNIYWLNLSSLGQRYWHIEI